MAVKRTVGAQVDRLDALRQSAERPLDDPPVAASGRDMAVAELVAQDHVLLRPQRHHRLVAAPAVVGPRRRALAGRQNGRVEVDRRHALGRALLKIGNHRRLRQTQTAQGQTLLAHRRLAAAQQGQVRLLEAGQEIARRLRRRQVVTQQKRQTVAAAQGLQVLARLPATSPQRQQALNHLRRRQSPLAALEKHLPIHDRSRPAAAEILQQDPNPAVRRHRTETNLMIQFEIKSIPRHPSIPSLTKQVKPLESKNPRNSSPFYKPHNP
jgi:hypothetical protein